MTSRTSITHPIRIDAVTCEPHAPGKIGITFCPGKQQISGLTGPWQRNLSLDVAAIAEFGAAAVVTLIEDHEFELLRVKGLGAEVIRHHMEWFHLPITDMDVPGPEFEAQWLAVGVSLRARLRDGFDVVVHCMGGLGRAGTIAARLLVELGMNPREAIARVREVRPGAIQTSEQARYVEALEKSDSTPWREVAGRRGNIPASVLRGYRSKSEMTQIRLENSGRIRLVRGSS